MWWRYGGGGVVEWVIELKEDGGGDIVIIGMIAKMEGGCSNGGWG